MKPKPSSQVHIKGRGTGLHPSPAADPVSHFQISQPLHVLDARREVRGEFPAYRPGDIWRMLQGTVFQR